MKYQNKSSISYMFRNFLRLAPWGALAAITLGLFFNTDAEMSFVRCAIDGTLTSENILQELMNAVSVMRFGRYWWGAIAALLLLAFTESMYLVKVERHMRVGEMPVFPLKRAFGAFPTVALFVLCVTVCVEALNLITVGVAFLIKNAGVSVIAAISLTLLYLTRVLATTAVSAMLFAFPIMFLENYSLNNALAYSVRLMSEKRAYMRLFALIYPLARLALSIVCYFVGNDMFTVTVFSVFYLLAIILVPCLTFKLYYDTVGGDRRDIRLKMF